MAQDVSRRCVIGGFGATAAGAILSPVAGAAVDGTVPRYLTATDSIDALVSRRISSRELVDTAIARIEALDPKVNAVVVRDFDRARAAADAADAASTRGDRRPLLGLPMTVKEQFGVAGLPTTWGFPKFHGWKSEVDALVVERLKKAGAIILGKTNVPINLADWQSYNEVYGTTNNPWDGARSPGGSAAALAAGYVPLELDRISADHCVRQRISAGCSRISRRSTWCRSAAVAHRKRQLSRSVATLRCSAQWRAALRTLRSLSVIAGPDELMDGAGYKLALPPSRRDKLADFRVLVVDEHPLCPTANNVGSALNDMADRLAKAGCTILRESATLPDLGLTSRVYRKLLSAFSARIYRRRRGRGSRRQQRLCHLTTRAWRRRDCAALPWAMPNGSVRAGPAASFALAGRRCFRIVDVMLCPPMPTQAFPHDHSPQYTRTLDVDGTKIPYNDQSAWVGIAILTGLPSTTMPIAQSDGLPIGMQITGGYLEDRTTIAFAGLVEREFGGFKAPLVLRNGEQRQPF